MKRDNLSCIGCSIAFIIYCLIFVCFGLALGAGAYMFLLMIGVV